MVRITLKVIALTGTLIAAAAVAQAQTFPNRAITMVVPFAAGGLTDAVMRMVGQKVSENTGQPFVIENKPTGAGTVGALQVKQAPPDGYTLFFGHSGTHAVNPAIMSKVPYDAVKDFQPITNLITAPNLLVVPASSPARTVKELVELAKTKPGGLSYASQGIGTAGHVNGELFRHATQSNMTHVPYRGGAPAAVDTAAGRVDLLFTSYLTIRAMLEDGRVRPRDHLGQTLAAPAGRADGRRGRLSGRRARRLVRGPRSRRHAAARRPQAQRGVRQSDALAAGGQLRRRTGHDAGCQHAGGVRRGDREGRGQARQPDA